MSFWGIEVKPEKPYPYHSDDVPGRLHITQATLGLGSSSERSIVQCTVGHKSPIFLCALLPGKSESCSLNLEFNEDDLVAFSVIGPRSVHLSGYFEATDGDIIRDDYNSDSYEENMIGIESDESDGSEFDTSDDYGGDSSDAEEDDFVMLPHSPVRNSGVVIEEIEDEKPESKPLKKKSKSRGSEAGTSSQQKIVVRGNYGVPGLESEDEDEDGFPISTKHESKSDVLNPEADVEPADDKSGKNNKKKSQDGDKAAKLKRKVESVAEEGGRPEKKNKKNKNLKEQGGKEKHDENQSEEHLQKKTDEVNVIAETTQVPDQSQSEEKKKKKKKKNKKKGKDDEGGTNPDQTVVAKDVQKKSSEEKQSGKLSKVRTYPNGLTIEEVSMGKPDGKRATPGKQVLVRYIGKLKNGKIFDSNIGKRPFKFRLGTGQVISGWDVGVNGMRVGDKRRLTIPPEMGYGSKGAGGVIPPNSWLMFDVELVDVQ